jgi:cell division transport system ATP-binding protein
MIEFRSVQKMYEDKKMAISDASFKINQGEFVFFSGKSGAGKSTLLSMIYKEEVATSGNILIFNKDIKKTKTKILRRKVGVVFQSFNLLQNKTAYENVAYVLECLGKNPFLIKKTTMTILDKLGLKELANKYPKQLSGGEQQRVAIARAIANKPKILICDEPTNNLDEENTNMVIEHLKELNSEGITILMATHDQRIIQELNKKTIYVNDGVVTVKDPDTFDITAYGG